MIKSPFDPSGLSSEACQAIDAITKLEGHDHFLYIGVTMSGDKVKIVTTATILSEGLVEHLREIADGMEEEINENGKGLSED